MWDYKLSYFIVTASFFFIVKSTAQTLEQGRYFYFSDEEDVIHKIDILEKIDDSNLLQVKGEYIVYWLYTRNNQNPVHVNSSNIDPNKVTVLIIHGWLNDRNSPVNTVLTEAFLQNADVNVIVVDWSYISRNIFYIAVVAAVPEVGKYVGKFLKWLNNIGVSFDHIHVVGFSLGAHVAGNAGRETGSKILRITGLDPAGPLFDNFTSAHLVKTDAKYVEIIHTNTRLFGVNYRCGHADFYPNGGVCMPDCIFDLCSHSKSYYYMAQSVKYNNMIAHECLTIDHVNENICNGDKYPMGNSDLSKNRTGLFRVNTQMQRDNKNLTSLKCSLYSIDVTEATFVEIL